MASPYGLSLRKRATRQPTTEADAKPPPTAELSSIQRTCLQLQDAIQRRLHCIHCEAKDLSVSQLQRRLLGPRRYWYRYVKQEKSGAKRWEARLYEAAIRKSTLQQLRSLNSLAKVPRLAADDLQLRSLGFFDSEKQATQAYEAAFTARERSNPLQPGKRHPLPDCLASGIQLTIVSEVFARRSHRQRLALVYSILLDTFAILPPLPNTQQLKSYSYVGTIVSTLPEWRTLPFHIVVVVKTPSQWKPPKDNTVLAHTERFGLSHLQNDRALGVDASLLPVSRGLLELLDDSGSHRQSKLPHFYHGLPDELKRMVNEEHSKATITATSTSAFAANSEATFLPKYTKRRRELTVAAVRIQRLYRSHFQYKALRSIAKSHRAATVVSRVWRGNVDRVFASAYRTVMAAAATIVQAVYRSYTSRQRTRALRVAMEHATLDIQRVYRGHRGRKHAAWVRRLQHSARQVQRVARGFVDRQHVRRRRLARHKRLVLTPAATHIQRVWRGFLGRRIAAHKRELHRRLSVLQPAALTIERLMRGFLARRLAQRFRRAWLSASVIQKHWRWYRYRCKWLELLAIRRRHVMATKIGAIGRGFVARRFVARERRRRYKQYVLLPAALNIQRVFRGHVVRRANENVRDRIEAAITLQQMWRKRTRIRTIQLKLRGFRDAIRHAAATRLQYWYKCCVARGLLHFLQAAARAARGKATLVIQSAWRSYCSRKQLKAFRLCSRVERKAQALTRWKESREDIEFDLQDAHVDLKRLIKYKAKSLRRIHELKAMRREWERRQPVVDKELSELTQEDLDRGWGEAFTTEKHVLHFSLQLSVEDILGRKQQIREYDLEIDDLRLEIEDLERDMEECIVDETMELENYRDTELQTAHRMHAEDQTRRVRLQRVRWGVHTNRKNVVARQREDVQRVEKELLAQRQVQELGALGFARKQELQAKMEHAIERVVRDRAKQSEVMMEIQRDAKVMEGFDAAIHKMGRITSQYSYEYRLPKRDMRDESDSPMCGDCGRITCDCEEREASRVAAAMVKVGVLPVESKSKQQRAGNSRTNFGHPLRRRRDYQQNE